jgi:acetolactate synthase-1/2/3 large subunit
MLKQKYSEVRQEADKDAITPRMAISALCDASSEGDFISVDVGSHQMWFAQTWKVKRGQTVLTNGGMGPMGCSLPSAVGISISRGLAPVWVVVGDGGMQVNIQELQTAARHDIPLKIAVINNHSLGMLTQFQTENFQGRMTGSIDGYDAPDFVKVARAYGIAAERAESRQDLHGKIDWLSKQKGPCLLDITVPRLTWVLPKSSYSRPVHDMAPPLGEGEDAEAKRFLK